MYHNPTNKTFSKPNIVKRQNEKEKTTLHIQYMSWHTNRTTLIKQNKTKRQKNHIQNNNTIIIIAITNHKKTQRASQVVKEVVLPTFCRYISYNTPIRKKKKTEKTIKG